MSAKYEDVKRFYDFGMWDIVKVRNAVRKNWITAEEFRTITGTEYAE